MRKIASGAEVVREMPEPRGNGENRKLPVGRPLPASKPRWSGSLQELADRKRAAKVSRPPRSGSAVGKTAAPKADARSGPQQAPLLLPAAACSARTRLLVFYRRWNCDRRWRVPCWLTSLLLHLLAVVVLGSITVPVSNRRTVVSILLSFGDLDAPADEGTVELATTMTVAAVDAQSVSPQVDHKKAHSVESQPPMQTGPSMIDVFPPSDKATEPPSTDQTVRAGGALPGDTPPGQSDVAQRGDTETCVVDTANKEHDAVVERFIQFDIGRLQGAEGTKARQEFERLGPEAIASLVRGLNRSATIHASCPVMVISNKLEAMMRENPDPALLRYALRNIGRGVPAKAPHLGRLQGLVYQLRQFHPSKKTSPNVSMILAAVQGGNRQRIIEAANVVAADGDKLIEFERRLVAWPLIRLLTHRDSAVRRAAHEALVALADGEDCGPDDDRLPADRFAAAGQWSLRFDAERYEAAADSVLKTAQHLDDAGKPDAARRYYARLVQEYPGTSAAEEAAEQLERPKALAFK